MSVHCYYRRGKPKGKKLCEAFAAGAGGKVVDAWSDTQLASGPAAFYGWQPETYHLFEQARRDGRDWYYIDNAYYFGREVYFRATRNAMQHSGIGNAGPERFERFGVTIKPWRKTGEVILITTQSDLWHRTLCGMTQAEWGRRVAETIRQYTDREIVICDKPRVLRYGEAHASGFEGYLEKTWALVTHSSSTAVKALAEGIPVFPLVQCCASVMGADDLSMIETPRYPDGREQWLWNLAANQWTVEEMASGYCWKMLQEAAVCRN
jgi:hypothetical protein